VILAAASRYNQYLPQMNSLIQDAHFTFRLVRKRPGSALLVVATLVLGIGLNTAIFSVINAVILRPLPVRDPDRILSIYAKVNSTGATLGISYPEFLDWKTQARSFQDIACPVRPVLHHDRRGISRTLEAFAISASGFRTWGINTIVGRELNR
jgi:hypothetical protein